MSKIITIWGSPNSGKTTISIKLAKELSKYGNVIMLSTDIITPQLGVILPLSAEKDKSVGKLLDKITLTQEDVLKNLITLKDNKNISFLGYSQGENYKTYADYSVDRANELIVNLSHIADYVVIDSSSIIMNDNLTIASLKLADEVIRLCGSDLKAISYFKSVCPLLNEKSFNLDNHINVISKLMDNDPKSMITNHYNNIHCELPYLDEILTQYREGYLLDELESKNSSEFITNFNKLLSKFVKIEELPKEKKPKDKAEKKTSKTKPKIKSKREKKPLKLKRKKQDDWEEDDE